MGPIDRGLDARFSAGRVGAYRGTTAAHNETAQGHRRDLVLEEEGKRTHQFYSSANSRLDADVGGRRR